MRGRYPVSEVYDRVTKISPGAYILSRDGRAAHYVGRSDEDLARRIADSQREGTGYRYFWFEYASSPMQAYYLECEWYHRYAPPDNTNHPAVPPETYWRCPVAGCSWS